MPGLLDGWQTTVSPVAPAPQSAPGTGGLFSNIGNSLNSALSNPLFQFGVGMAGAGSQGQGIGGGLLSGAQNAPTAMKILQAQRQMKFQADLNDPNSATYRALSGALSPAAMTAVSANPDLLQTLFAHKGDLETAKAVANINANASVMAKIKELQFQRDYNMQMLNQMRARMGGGGQPSLPQIGTIEDGYRFKGGNPSDPSSWEPAQ